ncbi:MAG: TIGR02556 family CRISPR-associated protein [Victivallales bacterium]|nr:TIGR02556 family CRISPR-associated protein [Victivallales bacterium]MCF7888736.1 TIGR02556 family CRISPR-associated protein [Victivallales bacterium]
MINKLYKLRKYIPDDMINISPYGLCLDKREEKVIVLEFNTISEKPIKVQFTGTHTETYTREKNETRFFLKQVAGNGTSEFPTLFISNKNITDLERSMNKFYKILNKYSKLKSLNEFYDIINSNLHKNLTDSKDLWILTITIDNKYVGELELFGDIRKDLEQNLLKSYYELTPGKEIKVSNKTCSVCLKEVDEVWGYVSTFNFYTAKTEFAPIASGFNKENAWKNYPVCPACAKQLEEAKSALEKYMNFKFCGFSYFLVPEFLADNEEIHSIMEVFLDKDSTIGKFTMSDKERNTISEAEDEILDILQYSKNIVNYTLFFYEGSQQKFQILLTIEGVYPSQFKEIFNTKYDAENFKIFKNLKRKNKITKAKELYDLTFKFEHLKEFVPVKSKKYGDFSKAFLDLTRSVFLNKKIDKGFLFNRIAETVQRRDANNKLYSTNIFKIILTLKFFHKLGILDLSSKNDEKEVIVDKKYQDFFNKHLEFFDCSSKKVVFLEGVLCQKLLNWQWRERNATPFRNKLNGLKMNPRIIQKLLPEIIEKLEQYGRNYYHNLEETISELFLESKLNKLPNDEISFYFVMGMNLVKEFFKPEEKEENEAAKTVMEGE